MNVTGNDWVAVLPALLLALGGLAAVALDLRKGGRALSEGAAYASLLAALVVVVARLYLATETKWGFNAAVVLDPFALLFSLSIVVATGLMALLSGDHLRGRGVPQGEFYALLLTGAAGMVLLVQAAELVTFFIALEILSLCVYVLSGLFRRDPRSNEASVKYFVTGAFATGFLLYGAALLYGSTGSLRLDEIAKAAGSMPKLTVVGLVLFAVGVSFKVGAVPFHMWVADVYEGAPTSVTAFMSVAVKSAGFGGFLRLLLKTQGAAHAEVVTHALAGVAIATMVVGNLLAVWQQSVKRMLAYSSVAHTGYVLVGVVAAWTGRDAASAAGPPFYLLVYTFMTLGAFAFVILAGRAGREAEDIEDYAGLAKRHPWAALAMTVFMVSLAGIPPTAGFFGKFLLFKAAVDAGHAYLVVVGVLTSALSAYYYLRVVVYMYMMAEPAPAEEKPLFNVGLVVAIAAVFTLLLGLVPSPFLEYSFRSIQALVR